MGIFSKIKGKANDAIDKAIDPEKEIDMAIFELEEGRKKALQELVTYKATAKTLDNDIEKYKAKAAEWERRAMIAVKAGDDEAAKTALREKKNAEIEVAKITQDKHEAQSYAIQLNRSRKDFETKLQMLKLRKGTLATQLAAARNGGDVFGNSSEVWDKFQRAEERIDAEAIETEVDAAMRGEDFEAHAIDAKLAALPATAADSDEDPLAKLKAKMLEEKAARQKQIAAVAEAAKGDKK